MNSVKSCSIEYIFNEKAHANVARVLINLGRVPRQLRDCNSMGGYYRDQIEFFALEPDTGEEYEITIGFIVHIGVNPGYDNAVQSLLGHKLWTLYADYSDDVADFKARLAQREGFELTNEAAKEMVHRLMLNSTFL